MSDPVPDLDAADEAYREIAGELERYGEERARRVADAYEEFTALLDRYEGTATGSGREVFQAYVEFEGKLAEFMEDLPEDLPEYESFETASDVLDRRRLDERDFERARGEVASAAEIAGLFDRRAEARQRYREARRAVNARIEELGERIDGLKETLAFAEADLDAPVGELREPIEAYNDAVAEAFRAFNTDTSAREVLDLVDAAEAYPLVPVRSPPEELREYLFSRPVGEEPIPTLLEYAGYSLSKLGHYVDDPGEFKGVVAANRTYLERLDAGAFTIGWPPPPADRLRFLLRELIAVVGRFAPEEVIEHLREVRALARDGDYERLREAAHADHELSTEERERLASGELREELDRLREERDRLERALSRYPER